MDNGGINNLSGDGFYMDNCGNSRTGQEDVAKAIQSDPTDQLLDALRTFSVAVQLAYCVEV